MCFTLKEARSVSCVFAMEANIKDASTEQLKATRKTWLETKTSAIDSSQTAQKETRPWCAGWPNQVSVSSSEKINQKLLEQVVTQMTNASTSRQI